MNEIGVGEFVRLDRNQGINKIIDITDDGLYELDEMIADEWGDGTYIIGDEDIVKHSKNKIELVEVGDYVNGERIHTITTDKHLLTERNENILDKYRDIETLVTKEQFKEREYIF